MTVNENETVNQSQSPPAGGSGDSPEKLVADHVENLWEHIAADGYDLLADVAVESLTRNGDVPPDAYLRSVKMSWCLHRAATYYARQYSVERVSADYARGDAQFEHSLRAQAEREAEKLKADLAQSSLLVENLRLRIEEARAQGAEWCEEINKLRGSLGARREELTASFTANQELRQKLETAEAALLEQQQRNEELVTQNSQQFMKIAELQRQVEGAKTQQLEGRTQELPAEYTPPEGWRVLAVGERLRDGDLWVNHQGGLWPTKRVGETVNDERYIRRIESQPEPQPEPQPQPEPCAPCDSRDTCDTPATEYTPPEGWRVLRFGEQLLPGDVWVNHDGTEELANILQWDAAAVSGGRCIRRIKPEAQPVPVPLPEPVPEPEAVQVCEGRWRTRGGDIKNIRPCEPLRGAYYVWPWTDGFTTYQDNGRHLAAESNNDLVQYLGPIEPQVEAVTTNRGDDSGGN